MKRLSRKISIIIAEVLIFSAMLAVIWLDEFLDVPYRLFGAPPTPYRIEEYIIETASCALIGIVIITGTLLLLRRLDRVERYLRVCAWCRKVWMDDRWVTFEEYLSKQHTLQASHGMCPECMHKLTDNAQNQNSKK